MNKNDFISVKSRSGKIRGGITLRSLSLPENGNQALHVCQDPQSVMKNRKALSQMTLPLENWVLPWQKHTNCIKQVSGKDAGRGTVNYQDAIDPADGLFTTEKDLLIGVYTADCLGILLMDETVPVVMVIHSGWKGTVAGILAKGIERLKEENLFFPQSLEVYFSPSIQQNSFEIQSDVKDQLLEAGRKEGLDFSDCILAGRKDHWLADHQKMNLKILEKAGIPSQNIHSSMLDTKTNPTCFSYRRDGKKTGEHFTFGYIPSTPAKGC